MNRSLTIMIQGLGDTIPDIMTSRFLSTLYGRSVSPNNLDVDSEDSPKICSASEVIGRTEEEPRISYDIAEFYWKDLFDSDAVSRDQSAPEFISSVLKRYEDAKPTTEQGEPPLWQTNWYVWQQFLKNLSWISWVYTILASLKLQFIFKLLWPANLQGVQTYGDNPRVKSMATQRCFEFLAKCAKRDYENITIVAFSMGAVLAFDTIIEARRQLDDLSQISEQRRTKKDRRLDFERFCHLS